MLNEAQPQSWTSNMHQWFNLEGFYLFPTWRMRKVLEQNSLHLLKVLLWRLKSLTNKMRGFFHSFNIARRWAEVDAGWQKIVVPSWCSKVLRDACERHSAEGTLCVCVCVCVTAAVHSQCITCSCPQRCTAEGTAGDWSACRSLSSLSEQKPWHSNKRTHRRVKKWPTSSYVTLLQCRFTSSWLAQTSVTESD